MSISEGYINQLVSDIVSKREHPIQATKFIVGDIGNDDDPNTKIIKDKCNCNLADVVVKTGKE